MGDRKLSKIASRRPHFKTRIHESKAYLSSYFVIMQVKCCSGVVSFLQFVNKTSRFFLSKLDVITTASPLPSAVCIGLCSCLAALTSSYSVLAALMGELMCNAGWADGVKESCFTSGWNEMIIRAWDMISTGNQLMHDERRKEMVSLACCQNCNDFPNLTWRERIKSLTKRKWTCFLILRVYYLITFNIVGEKLRFDLFTASTNFTPNVVMATLLFH